MVNLTMIRKLTIFEFANETQIRSLAGYVEELENKWNTRHKRGR